MKKVAILGTAETLTLAPFNDPEFEIWALNDMYTVVPRATRWFEMHNRKKVDTFDTISVKPDQYYDWFKTCGIPVYMQQKHDDIPTSIEYPLREIIKRFGRQCFNSTVDYMIAFAIYEGFEEIHLYGINMAFAEEYGEQKPSCEYWLGRAEGAGIKVVLPESCDLLKCYFMYGYDERKKSDLMIKAKAKIADLDQKSKEFMKNYYLSIGAKDTWEFVMREIR